MDNQGPEIPSRRPARAGAQVAGNAAAGGMAGAVAKFRTLPLPAQVVLGLAMFGLVYMVVGGGKSPSSGASTNTTTAQALAGRGSSSTEVFQGIDADRPVLMQSWLEQNRRDLANMQTGMEKKFEERDMALQQAMQQNAELQRQMQQMMSDFTAEIQNMQTESQRDRDMLSQLADEQKKQELSAPVDGASGVSPLGLRREKINQTVLGGGGGVPLNGSQALLAPIGRVMQGQRPLVYNEDGTIAASVTPEEPLPFMPPLGFVRGTLLNGLDALVGGQPTPALVRLHGTYKTAMNSQVKLDGCLALVEFQGEVSTERAVGKPARMTCVYPDRGAVTYDLSGYVVDAEDGIIGMPGVFYEGDASRIAAAMLADFAAGISDAVEANQTTESVTDAGLTVSTLTGSETKAEIAKGVSKATKSLRDYLMERVNRVLPFIRIDSTRDVHLVLLSGVELRSQGSPWTLLFDGAAADQARNQFYQNRQNAGADGAPVAVDDAAVLPPRQGGN